MNWFLAVVQKKYAEFSGRARRAEYWYFILFYTLIFLGLLIVDALIGMASFSAGIGLLSGIFSIALLVPSLAVGVRRLHDTDRSGWWLLIALIPLVGGLVLLYFTVLPGTAGDNRFGPDPKAVV